MSTHHHIIERLEGSDYIAAAMPRAGPLYEEREAAEVAARVMSFQEPGVAFRVRSFHLGAHWGPVVWAGRAGPYRGGDGSPPQPTKTPGELFRLLGENEAALSRPRYAHPITWAEFCRRNREIWDEIEAADKTAAVLALWCAENPI